MNADTVVITHPEEAGRLVAAKPRYASVVDTAVVRCDCGHETILLTLACGHERTTCQGDVDSWIDTMSECPTCTRRAHDDPFPDPLDRAIQDCEHSFVVSYRNWLNASGPHGSEEWAAAVAERIAQKESLWAPVFPDSFAQIKLRAYNTARKDVAEQRAREQLYHA